MEFDKSKQINIQIDENKAFTQKIKQVDTTYTNRLIANVRVNVPDLDDNRVRRFHIDPYKISPPITSRISANSKFSSSIKINSPDYIEKYRVKIAPYNDYVPFVGNECARPDGELAFRNKSLTPINKLEKINISLDDKINMKKW